MPATRIALPLIVFVAAIGIALAASLLPFIPTWHTFQVVTTMFALAAGLAAAVWLIRGVWLQTGERLTQGFRLVLAMAASFLIGASLLFVCFLSLVGLNGFLFPPIYSHQVDFPAYETTIYVFDTSFLDPSTSFSYRKGWLPFLHEIGNFGGVSASDVQIVQEGEWAVADFFKLHLPTAAVERLGY